MAALGWFRDSDQCPRMGLCLSPVGFMFIWASQCELGEAVSTLDLTSTTSIAQEENSQILCFRPAFHLMLLRETVTIIMEPGMLSNLSN